MKSVDFLKLHIDVLEEFFSPTWFSLKKNNAHPAHRNWALCHKLIDQGGIIKYPEQRSELNEIAKVVLDSVILVTITEGDSKSLKLGSLDLFGDEAVKKKITSRITDPEQFDDLMVELSFAAWHKKRGNKIVPFEKECLPDLKLEISGASVPIYFECKHLRSISTNRLNDVIKKANSQIKAVDEPHFGIAVLDVSTPASIGLVESDDVPDKIKVIETAVQNIMNYNKNRSVEMAILLWDEYKIRGKPPEKTMIYYKRRHLRVPHMTSCKPILLQLPLFKMFWTAYSVLWKT
ncbi:hypothetical protein ACFLU9_00710 [Chloroflexota bacterium]